MRFGVTILITLSLLAACGQEHEPLPRDAMSETVDDWRIAVTCYVPDADHPPVLLLAHRYGGHRRLWDAPAQRLLRKGYLVATFDLRGHGDSRLHAGQVADYRTLRDEAWQEALRDFDAARQAALAAGGDPDNVAVAGEGLGADLALYYALAEPAIQAVVLLSPGLHDKGIDTMAGMRRLRETPSLLMAGDADTPSARAVHSLHDAAPVFADLRTYPTGAYGADLLVAVPEAYDEWIQWLEEVFRNARTDPSVSPG